MIIYLHGFNSSGATVKGATLKRLLEPIHVSLPSYHHDPAVAIRQLEVEVECALERFTRVMLIGSSLGGFYAQSLGRRYGLNIVLINPALDPISTLAPHVGPQTNYHTGERYCFERRHLEALAPLYVDAAQFGTVPTLVLLDADDEVIDPEVAARLYRDRGKVIAFPGGDHAFQHLEESIADIRMHHDSAR
ncbi:MAG: YqiA/YcfP family alpha/beta fold hydrolase [Gammaproteobacteria bacterium]